ncbi:MAG: peptidoglycan DD-metalloendopeptidase family protein [Spirochaetes bacterium]|nr:peptidoglycan DD-metalloendopeptidase family protein [Spirochaetota bacterium]
MRIESTSLPSWKYLLVSVLIFFQLLPWFPAYPDSKDGYYGKLKKSTEEKNFKSALGVARSAMGEYPDEEGFTVYAIWSLRELKQFDEAIALGRKAMKQWPDSKGIRENLAWALTICAGHIIENKLSRDPLPLAREGYNLHPAEGTMLWLGISLRHNREFAGAERVLKEGMAAYPYSAYFRPNLAWTYIEWGQRAREEKEADRALDLFAKAHGVDPANEGALLWHGIALREKKDFDGAMRLFIEGKKSFPGNRYFTENLRWTCVEWAARLTDNNEEEKARALLSRARAELPGDPFILQSLALTYFRRDHKKWESLSREALTLVPKEKLKALGTYQMPLKSGRIMIHQGNMEAITHLGIDAGYAWDFVLVRDDNSYGKTWEKKEDHLVFGQPVYAARDGIVDSVYDGSPDTEPGKNGPFEVNRIMIRHPDGELSYYAHLRKGSSVVKKGDTVRKGQQIALVGSSGRYVDFPHLHFQVMRDNLCVEARITGIEIFTGGAWRDKGPITPGKKELLRSTW